MGGSEVEDQRYHGPAKRLLSATALVLVAWLVRRRPFVVAVEGSSMAPTLQDGDLLVAARRGRVHKGSLVLIEHPSQPGFEMVKRVEAMAGDRSGEWFLGADQYFVLGDDPSASTDSRQFGPIAGSAIRGVVRARYWPPSRVRLFG